MLLIEHMIGNQKSITKYEKEKIDDLYDYENLIKKICNEKVFIKIGKWTIINVLCHEVFSSLKMELMMTQLASLFSPSNYLLH